MLCAKSKFETVLFMFLFFFFLFFVCEDGFSCWTGCWDVALGSRCSVQVLAIALALSGCVYMKKHLGHLGNAFLRNSSHFFPTHFALVHLA